MKIRIPRQHKEGLTALVRYSPEELARITELVAANGPMTSVTSLAKSVAATGELDEEETIDLLYAIGSLVQARDSLDINTEGLIEELRKALSEDQDEKLHPPEETWPEVQRCLETLIDGDSALVLTAKASAFLYEQDKAFCSTKIVSDLRPILDEAGEKPIAAMALHSLRITYHKRVSETDTVFISMTKDQLISLKATIERALLKEEALAKIASAAGLSLLDQGE